MTAALVVRFCTPRGAAPRRSPAVPSPKSSAVIGALCLALLGCRASYRICPAPLAPPALVGERLELAQTGLFQDLAAHDLTEGVTAYAPSYELWSDGADKRRWIWLPPGASIDASDMDGWQFPVGTKLWKEFSRQGVRLETRLLEKVGPAPDAWFAMAFVWNETGTGASAAPLGATNILGTSHDAPAASDCGGCHGGTPSRVLGFSAVQLNHEAPANEWTLERLLASGRLSGARAPVPPIPGDSTTRDALGYLHANCAHCHNQRRPPQTVGGRCYDPRREFDLSLFTTDLYHVENTAVFRTTMGSLVVPGDPEASPIYKRARGDLHLFQARMPPLGAELLDPALLPLLAAWIADLPREPQR